MEGLATTSVLFACFLLTGSANFTHAGDTSKIDVILQRAVEQGDVSGVVAIAATSEGIIYQGAFGKRNVAQNEAMTPDTIFRIASMTKPVTSVAAMQLVEERVLTLDTKAG